MERWRRWRGEGGPDRYYWQELLLEKRRTLVDTDTRWTGIIPPKKLRKIHAKKMHLNQQVYECRWGALRNMHHVYTLCVRHAILICTRIGEFVAKWTRKDLLFYAYYDVIWENEQCVHVSRSIRMRAVFYAENDYSTLWIFRYSLTKCLSVVLLLCYCRVGGVRSSRKLN